MDINESIKCTVDNCRYNQESKHYCTLDQIQVGTHEYIPSMDQCTDCKSYEVRSFEER